MIKFGITQRGRRERRALRRENEQRGWWPFAYTLLGDLETSYDPTDEALLERLYRSMAGGAIALKITRRNRFGELDARIQKELDRRFVDGVPLAVHDAAVSNGITSLELFRVLSSKRSVEFWATDLFDSIWIVRLPSRRWEVVFDVNGSPLQVVGMGLVFSCRRRSDWRYPLNRMIEAWVIRRIVPVAERILKRQRGLEESKNGQTRSEIRQVRLFHPECLEAEREDLGFHLSRHDITEQSAGRFHLVRVMNALTPKHIDEELVCRGIRACAASLLPRGVLVLGRSPEECDDQPRATAFEWSGDRLLPIWSLNGGYEWPALVDAAG